MADEVAGGPSARDAAKAARRAARIKSDIKEIIPVRRRDMADAAMAQELVQENRNRVEARLREDDDDQAAADEVPHERRRHRSRHGREARSVERGAEAQNDAELSGAAPRTPAQERTLRATAATTAPSLAATNLTSSLGYAPPVAAVTMQSTAASYFRGNTAADLAATVMPLPPPLPASSASGTGFLSTFQGRAPFSLTGGSTRISAAGGPAGVAASTAAGAGAYSSTAGATARVPTRVYEESIATGAFRRIDPGLVQLAATQLGAKLGQPLSLSATFLRAKQASQGSGFGCCGGGRGLAGEGGSSVSELDAGERESMYGDIGLVVQSGCRIAQGLLAGTLLVIVLQLDRLSNPITFVQFIGPVLPQLRILMYVLSVLAFLGSAEQAMETHDALGAWMAQYAVVTDAASLRLSSTVMYTWTATIAYLAACGTVYASMPSDNQLRVLGGQDEASLRADRSLPQLVDTWRAIIILRFVLVLLGMLASMFAASTPTDVYRAMRQAEEVDAELAMAAAAVQQAQAQAAAAASKAGSGGGGYPSGGMGMSMGMGMGGMMSMGGGGGSVSSPSAAGGGHAMSMQVGGGVGAAAPSILEIGPGGTTGYGAMMPSMGEGSPRV